MNESELELGENAVYRIQGDWDVDTVTEQIFGELNGTVSRSTIQEVLKDVIPKYESARIQLYVPIFLRRDAVKQLKSMQAPFAEPGMATNEADARNGSQANSDPSPRRIDRDELDKTKGIGSIHLKPAVRGDLMETTV